MRAPHACRSASAALLLALAAAGCSGTGAPEPPAPTPGTATGGGTSPAITAADLRLRLEAFADDSMMGREAGTRGNAMATAWLAEQARALGLQPAGENGTFFQEVPLVATRPMTESTLTVDGRTLVFGQDFLPVPVLPGVFEGGWGWDVTAAPLIYGGWPEAGDASDPGDVRGAVVVVAPAGPPAGPPDIAGWIERFDGAAVLVLPFLDGLPASAREFLGETGATLEAGESTRPAVVFSTGEAALALLGDVPTALEVGRLDRTVTGRGGIARGPADAPARNVVAVLPGSDPARRGEYVALGAHSDHVGVADDAVDHDSIRATNAVIRTGGAEDEAREPTADEARRIRARLDSIRAAGAHPADSIFNGADDDGSGSVALLEIAEMYARGERPARSLLFVWHTAEELGLLGAEHFTSHPTVALDAVVAQINVDMIGRGMTGDVEGGGMDYLQVVGSRRLSSELGELVESVNRREGFGFDFDYTYDAPGHEAQIYCRSDHAAYASHGIPVAFFTTGGHPDYHQRTDEVRYIDFGKLEHTTRFIAAVAGAVADLDHRVVVDGEVPADPDAPCVQ